MVLLAARIWQAAAQPPPGTGHHAREQPRPGPRAHRGCGPRDPHGRRRPGGTFSSRTSRGCGGWLARYSGGCPGSTYWSTTSAGTGTPGTSPLTAPALVNALVIALLGGLR